MTNDTKPPEGWSLERWSRLKHGATRETSVPAVPPAVPAPPAAVVTAPAAIDAGPPAADLPDALPPVESLTIDSDFSAFLRPKVDEALKRQALKQLFRDPRFNVMDGLDVYVGDYSQPDPIDPDVVRQMVQGRYIFDPPPTRINAQGFAEDVPPEEVARAKAEAIAAADREDAASTGIVAQDTDSDVPPAPAPAPDAAEPPVR